MEDMSPEEPLMQKPEPAWRKYCRGQGFLVAIYSLGLLIASVGNNIFFKRMTNHIPNYPYFLTQFTTLVYVPIFGGVVAYLMYFTDSITPEMRQFPKMKFLVMGAMDSLSGVFMLFGGVKTSGSTQALLFQAVVPITMILSYLLLKERYKKLQMIGACIILGGVAFVLVPDFLNKSSKDDTQNDPIFNIIFLMSVVPQALSSIYKQLAFNDVDLEVNYLQYWVALWQLLVGCFLIPLNTFKFLGDNYMPWDKLPSALINGFKCLGGVNSVVDNCWSDKPINGLPQCDDCVGAYVPLMTYLLFNCAYNVFIALIVKHGSAALMYIIMTLRLPLINVAFALPFILDPPETIKWFTLVGLGTIIAGLGCYRYGSMAPAGDGAPSDADAGSSQQKVVMVGGMEAVALPVVQRLPLQRDEFAIRSNFYGRIGIVDSPRSKRPPPQQGKQLEPIL
eukprot:TRINITY_DN3903_c0_g1_i1.p1 TRINITY_DN3903_c0_g1~~TRINITY_DN3903_c0_g1_i1.p1  ORF type:complete len:449 (-),score=155.54 TRINITY_DN3903_c0_g1_i1:314-1660(-)